MIAAQEIEFYLYDHLGNTRVVYEPTYAGGLLELAINYAADYFPYGKVLREYVNTSTGDPEKFLTTQHERDKETGLDYRGARFYDSDVARFLSLDPAAKEYPSLSPYNYVGGMPTIAIDPDGRKIKFSSDLSRSERREIKSNMRLLNQGSGTFKQIYKDLKRSSETFTFQKVGADQHNYDSKTNSINVNAFSNNSGFKQEIVFAHELGHAWRDMNGLDISESPYEGTSPEVADNAMRSIGFPMSPFQLLDLVGPGVALHVSETLHANLGDRYRISPTMAAMVKEGVRNFYVKNEDGSYGPNPAALALIHKGDSPSTAEQVRSRALTALAVEARMMLDEGVVSTAAEIDLCMLMGAGWPMHLGGILPYLDREGISEAACGQRFHPKGVASLP